MSKKEAENKEMKTLPFSQSQRLSIGLMLFIAVVAGCYSIWATAKIVSLKGELQTWVRFAAHRIADQDMTLCTTNSLITSLLSDTNRSGTSALLVEEYQRAVRNKGAE
jgi:hypothetical protein